MAVGLKASVAAAILDALFRSVAWSEPAAIWIKLHTGDPGANGTANAAANTTRKQASFAAASGGSITTDDDLEWLNVPNAETYSHWSAWDDETAGNFVVSDDLAASRAVLVGDNFVIAAGDIDVTLGTVAA